MFIVLSVIAILSAIGAYAMSNSRYEVRTAGYVRQRGVSEQVAGIGGLSASAELGTAPVAYVQRMRLVTTTGETCAANGGIGSGGPLTAYPPCYHLYLSDVENRVKQMSGTGTFAMFQLAIPGGAGTPGTPGSLGLTPLNAGFWVEMTDPVQLSRPVAGTDINTTTSAAKFIDITLSANGVVFQDLPGGTTGVIDPNERPSATYTIGRGHVIVGPIYGAI